MGTSRTSFEDHGYSLQWDGRNRNAFTQLNHVLPSVRSLGERMCRPVDLVQPSWSEDSEMCPKSNLMILQSGKESEYQDFLSAEGKGLSLTLGSHLPSEMLIPSFHYKQTNPNLNLVGSSHVIGRGGLREHSREVYSFCGHAMDSTYASRVSQNHSNSTSNELPSFTSMFCYSRYLKPAQNLLEEVVSVGMVDGIDSSKLRKDRVLGVSTKAGNSMITQTRNMFSGNNSLSEETHDIQLRITKLVALLDEVDGRYEQYCRRMEEVASSFEAVAGSGAAKSYTTLALQAMSRHFGSLKDAIIAQIHIARRCNSEDFPRIHSGLSQLSLFDQNTRQKRAALQQLVILMTLRS
ncbi:BEL1-like homeodomain protein 3 isoform X2 [Tasmannia lanceolata]|uniref:BEL1-like homeodomain protein 3 isoform X2 n=1 Tax=Tasmannia lanceolata TaxID=3420 RepID=UPI004062C952